MWLSFRPADVTQFIRRCRPIEASSHDGIPEMGYEAPMLLRDHVSFLDGIREAYGHAILVRVRERS